MKVSPLALGTLYVGFLLLPAVPFLLAFLLADAAILETCDRIRFQPRLNPNQIGIAATAVLRIDIWVATFTAALIIMLVVTLFLISIMLKKMGGIHGVKSCLLAYAGFWTIACAVVVFGYSEILSFCVIGNVIAPTLDLLVTNGSGFFQRFRLLHDLNTYLNILVTIWFVVSIGSLLSSRSSSSPIELGERLQTLRSITYAGGVALTAGVIATTAFAQIGEGLLPKNDSKIYRDLIIGHQGLWGAVWSFVMLCAYLPAAYCLRGRAKAMSETASKAPDIETRSKWMKSYGLQFDLGGQLRQLGLMLGPLLGVPVSDLLGALAKV